MSESSEVVTLRSYLADAEREIERLRGELRYQWERGYQAGAAIMRGEAVERAAWEAKVCGCGERIIKHIERVEMP